MDVKRTIIITLGIFGSTVAKLLGGWDAGLQTLLLFMAVDYVTGLVVAGVFKKSKKSESGALESKAGFKGLCKKGVILLIVLVSVRLDILLNLQEFIRNSVVIAFCLNETISIIENAGLMGIPIPPIITQAIELLRKKSDKGDE